jgi:hypothetical protein
MAYLAKSLKAIAGLLTTAAFKGSLRTNGLSISQGGGIEGVSSRIFCRIL